MDVSLNTSRDRTMLLPMFFPMYHALHSSEEESSASNTGVADAFAIELDDVEMLDCFLSYPIFNNEDPHEYPLDYQIIQHYQQNDERLQAANECLPFKFPPRILQVTNGVELIVYQKEPNVPWQIALHDAILDQFIKGKCDACQRYKANNRSYGHLPP
eukprot:scaffold65111_cov48-Attheya_sp.AAC.1